MLLKIKKQKASYFVRWMVLPLAACTSLAFAVKTSLPEIKNPSAVNMEDLVVYTDTLPHNTPPAKKETDNVSGDDKIFKEVEKAAEFPGGRDAWKKYIAGKLKENMGRFTDQDYGTCKVKFIVAKDGTISDVKATNMADTRLAEVTINAIKKGPKWIPAEQNDRTVASYKVQTVTLMKPDNVWPTSPQDIRSKPTL